MKFDLHFHTTISDGSASPETMVKMIKKRGLNGFSITDHDSPGDTKQYTRAAEKYGLLFVSGMEITAEKGHLLVYTTPDNAHVFKEFTPFHPADYYIEKARELDVVLSPAHPFDYFRHGMGRTVYNHAWSCMETFNGSTVFPFANWRAEKAAHKMNLPEIGGTDAHTPNYVGFVYTEVDASTAEELVTCIRKGKTTVGGNHLTLYQFSRRLFGKMLVIV